MRDPVARVELQLGAAIDAGRRARHDLDGERRRPLDAARARARRTQGLQEHEIGLNDRRVAQDAVDGRHEDLAESVGSHVLPQEREELADDALVRQTWSRGHEQLSVV